MMGGRGWRHQLAALFQFYRLYRRSNCSKYQLSIEKFPFGIASSDAEIEVEQSNRKGGFGTALRYASLRNLGAKVDRKSVVSGKSVSVRVDLGVSRIIRKKNQG